MHQWYFSDDGKSAVAEAGAVMYKAASVRWETIFGEGSILGGLGNLLDGAS